MKILSIFVLIFVLVMAFNYGMDLILGIHLDNTLINLENFFLGIPISEAIFLVIIVAIFLIHIYSLSVKQKS